MSLNNRKRSTVILNKAAISCEIYRVVIEGLEDRRLLSVALPVIALPHAGHTARASLAQVKVTNVETPNFELYHRAGSSRPLASTAPVGMRPAAVRHAYGFDQVSFGSVTGDGSGQTIAIVDAYNAPNIVADLHTFDTQFGLADPPSFTRIGETGSSTLPRNDPSGPGYSWALETSLDVEWAHAMAPKANILLVLANSASDSDLFTAINTARRYAGVSAISMSWGGGEYSGQSYYDQFFTTPSGHNGVTFLASSGDSGSYDASATSTRAVEYPASSPNVVAVGGTRLNVDSTSTYVSESAWGNGTSSGMYGGAGGGLSTVVSQPSYQRGVVTQSSTARAVPDVAFDADPASGVSVVDSYDSPNAPWIQVGGTSLAAPMWAGLIAVANQGRVLNGLGTLDGATGALPKIYTLPSSDFHDVTTGNNGYAAGAGYDLVTGRGTPIVNRVVRDLAGSTTVPPVVVVPPSPPTPTIGSLSASPTSVVTGTSSTLTASNVVETNGTISGVKFYRESNGTSGLQTGTDTLVGTGTQSGTAWTIASTTSGFSAGNYTYYAVASDASNVSSNVVSAGLTVTTPVSTPVNNAFASATVLTGTSVSVSGSNANATKESGEPSHAGNAGGKSVWWSWTAPSAGKVTLTTAGSSFDTLLGVYTGSSVSALTTIASNDDLSGVVTSALTFTAVKGTTYRIAVDGYSAATGSIVLNLSQAVAAAVTNDSFANAAVLTGTSAVWNGSNIGASKETNEPRHAGNAGGASIWFTWTATSTKTVKIHTHGSSFDTLLGVYTGNAVGSLATVASNDDDPTGGTLTSAVSINAVAGQTYRIAVDGYAGASGSVALSLS